MFALVVGAEWRHGVRNRRHSCPRLTGLHDHVAAPAV